MDEAISADKFLSLASRAIEIAKNNDHAVFFLIINIGRIRDINDYHGREIGLSILTDIFNSIGATLEYNESIVSVERDFALTLMANDAGFASSLAFNVLGHIASLGFESVGVAANIGCTVVSGDDPGKVVSEADIACLTAKNELKNTVCVYDQNNSNQALNHRHAYWLNEIGSMVKLSRLVLYCQEIRPVKQTLKSCYEILLRGLNTDGEIVMPGKFLPSATKYNLSMDIDKWVFNASFDWLFENKVMADNLDRIAINLSGSSLNNNDFIEHILARLSQAPFCANKIKFEIIETEKIDSLAVLTCFMKEAQKYGTFFSLDDFGTGLSSFEYLITLPFNEVKIDGMFIKKIESSTDKAASLVVESVINIAREMKINVVAEYIENKTIKNIISEMGVDYLQGYEIGRPHPISVMRTLV